MGLIGPEFRHHFPPLIRAREEGAGHGNLEGAAGLLEKNDEETWSYCDLGWSVNLGSCMI